MHLCCDFFLCYFLFFVNFFICFFHLKVTIYFNGIKLRYKKLAFKYIFILNIFHTNFELISFCVIFYLISGVESFICVLYVLVVLGLWTQEQTTKSSFFIPYFCVYVTAMFFLFLLNILIIFIKFITNN